ncbi:PREDICTED: uncharacterized protein LOC109132421 [Camelina sativa]|uniref:Uncharacterized protein LOC109132421 n=1 Tax=Camelina sativa TaxID=90675 RepID=A0ABM1RKN6_CAMSA|nr:PREDICTED: uncharacterized protein LOC109132421 [Camelina sativa]
MEFGFVKCSKEPSVYRKSSDHNLLVVGVYVDDLFVTITSLEIIVRFKEEMSSMFEMSDLAMLSYYLGIKVEQHQRGITLNQSSYALKILEEAGLINCNFVHTPMETELTLSKAENEREIDATVYRKRVGCLRYLLHTRPDLLYCVRILSRSRVPKLISYSDSSHSGDPVDGRSTYGHVFYFGNSLITWCSRKQDVVALSSCEAEFMAGTEAAKQAIWLQDLLAEITGSSFEKVEVEHVAGTNQKADILTKSLGRTKFKEMRELMGVKDLTALEYVGLSLNRA